jgi:hypothetical protein
LVDGMEESLGGLYCNIRRKKEQGNVFVFVCDVNGKWLRNFYVLCLHLFYVEVWKI